MDETGEELRKIIGAYKTEAVKYGKKYVSQNSIFPFKENDFDLSFDLPQALGKTTFYNPESDLSESIVKVIQKGNEKSSIISNKLPNTSIKNDDKLVNFIIEAGDLKSILINNNILTSIKSNPLLSYTNSSGKISYADVLRDISNNRFRCIILKGSALTHDPDFTGNLKLDKFTSDMNSTKNANPPEKNNFKISLRSGDIILNSFYNDVIDSSNKKLIDIKYKYSFKNDPLYDFYFEEEIIKPNENMINIYNIYREGY